jgi:hypothetical protein
MGEHYMPRKVWPAHQRCVAEVNPYWGDGRCTRRRVVGKYCTQHAKQNVRYQRLPEFIKGKAKKCPFCGKMLFLRCDKKGEWLGHGEGSVCVAEIIELRTMDDVMAWNQRKN